MSTIRIPQAAREGGAAPSGAPPPIRPSAGGVYTWPARVAHWLTAGLLAVIFAIGVSMTRWIDGDAKFTAYSWHESIGLLVLAVTAFRLAWRLGHPPPPLLLPPLEHRGAQAVHLLLYAVLVVQPIVGWMLTGSFGFNVNVFGQGELPGLVGKDEARATLLQSAHEALAWTLVALFGLHLCGVLYHHLGKRDGVLKRMLPGAYESGDVREQVGSHR